MLLIGKISALDFLPICLIENIFREAEEYYNNWILSHVGK